MEIEIYKVKMFLTYMFLKLVMKPVKIVSDETLPESLFQEA